MPDELLAELDKFAPGSARKRSRFIRLAIEKALMDLQDVDIRERHPGAFRIVPIPANGPMSGGRVARRGARGAGEPIRDLVGEPATPRGTPAGAAPLARRRL